MEAARCLAGGDLTGFEVDEGILEDLKAMGASAEMIEAWKKAQAPERELSLLPDVFDSVRVFDGMGTQWDRAGSDGVRCGLKYGRIPVVMRGLRVPLARLPEVFEDLRVLEYETLRLEAEERRT